MKYSVAIALFISLCTVCCATLGAEVRPIVIYRATASWEGVPGAKVADASGHGNDGVVMDQPVRASTDVPPGAVDGEYSLDFSGDGEGSSSGSINMDGRRLLNNSAIVAAGGFTMETWFKMSAPDEGGEFASLIDYAGTERIQARVADDVLEFRISNNGPHVFSAQSLTELADNKWHHVIAQFVVTDGTMLNPVYGDIHITVDGVKRSEYGVALSNAGDNLNRAIGFGNHPERFGEAGYDGADDFDGLLFNPTVSLGAEPTRRWPWVVGVGLLGLGGLGVLSWILISGRYPKVLSYRRPKRSDDLLQAAGAGSVSVSAMQ